MLLRPTLARVDFGRAREMVLAASTALPSELVSLSEARDRVVTRSYPAEADLVPYARAAMDGFALRASDTNGALDGKVTLPVIGSLYAGFEPVSLAPGTAMAIATGAPLPFGADAVVPIERVLHAGDAIVLAAPLSVGQHVFPAGDDAKCGENLVRAGERLTPGRAALLAAAGYSSINVHRRPRVAVISTGDEVVAVNARPRIGQVRNSNATLLAAQVARDGASVVLNVHAGDSREPLQAALCHAVAESDLVITTGGASMGERDLVKSVFEDLGTRFDFRSVLLRPAKPTAFGRCGAALVAVLPGNPAAAFVAYAMLVRGAIRRMTGYADAFPAPIVASLEGSIRAKIERHYVLFGDLVCRAGAFSVRPLGNQCSSLVRTSADANAFIVVPPGAQQFDTGAFIDVEVLDWNEVRFAS